MGGLLHKISKHFSTQHVLILSSYLTDRSFYVHYVGVNSSTKPIAAGVPQGSVLGPLLYLLYTADIPARDNATMATFADDTAVLTSHEDYPNAVTKLQTAVSEINDWANTWKTQINVGKTIRVDFALRAHGYEPIYIYQQ